MNALPKDPKTRRKLLIYGGLAGALLLIVLLSRRGSDQTGTQPQDPTAVANPAPSDGGAGGALGGGVPDNGAQLADFENALLSQLPEAISSSILAGLGNGVPAPGGGNMTINIGTGKGGAKKPGHKKAKPHPHPAGHKHPHHKPKPHPHRPHRPKHPKIKRNV
jgi:hypothetical protein